MYGIALVQNVPRNLDGLPKLIKSVFNPEPNHYGSYYVVEQKENANNIAYTGADIGLHQDLPFYEKTMGVSNTIFCEINFTKNFVKLITRKIEISGPVFALY